MKSSFDEIRKIAFRSLNAAGAPPGIDEDAGWACAWLEAAGYPGLRMVADLLDDDAESLGTGLDHAAGSHIDAHGRSAVCLASLLVELAAVTDGGVTVRNLRHAPYLIAHASRLAKTGISLIVDPVEEVANDVAISHSDHDYSDAEARVSTAILDGLEVDTAAFDRVYAYSRAILVPQTETSLLSGAGAGLTDND